MGACEAIQHPALSQPHRSSCRLSVYCMGGPSPLQVILQGRCGQAFLHNQGVMGVLLQGHTANIVRSQQHCSGPTQPVKILLLCGLGAFSVQSEHHSQPVPHTALCTPDSCFAALAAHLQAHYGSATEQPRRLSFCGWQFLPDAPEVLMVPDATQDPR